MRALYILALAVFVTGCNMAIPRTPGAFIQAVEGEPFESMDTLDPRNAMVYIYRPVSRWGYEEVQAPTFFVDGQQLFGLKSGGYEWLELHGGRYDLYAKRPLGILYLETVFELPLEVEGGKSYFLRYSETKPVRLEEIVSNPEDYVQAGPVQQVPEGFALQEIQHLRLDEPGVYYGGRGYQEPRWAPFYTYPDPRREKARSNGDEVADAGSDGAGWWQRTTGWIGRIF
jgi:hypothetical protein